MTMICWRCHSNSVNTGSRLPICSDVKTRKRRNVVRIDMIRNNRIKHVVLVQSWYSLNKYNKSSIEILKLTTYNISTNVHSFNTLKLFRHLILSARHIYGITFISRLGRVSDCCLMPTQQSFSYIMARTS